MIGDTEALPQTETSVGAEPMTVEDEVGVSSNRSTQQQFQINDTSGGTTHHSRENSQATVNNNQQQEPTNSYYGDAIPQLKSEDSLLFTFLNINGLPQQSSKQKNNTIRNFIRHYNVDVLGMAEVNLNWSLVPTRDRWEERTIGWLEDSRVSMAYNVEDEATSIYQPGGCLQVTSNKLVNNWDRNGKDPTGLGRWTWSKFVGKDQQVLRVITAYRTSIPSSDPGENTAH